VYPGDILRLTVKSCGLTAYTLIGEYYISQEHYGSIVRAEVSFRRQK
jgi:hypothetical protein